MKYLFTILLFSNCITWYNHEIPENLRDNQNNTKLSYKIEKFDILDFGGRNGLRKVFRKGSLFSEAEEVTEDPKQGYYVQVKEEWQPLSAPALIFGYISIASATFFPAYSTSDGYLINYNLYRNGEKVKTFKYSIGRGVFLWFATVPFLWVNLITESEEEVFYLTGKQFAKDVQSYLK